MKTLFAAVLVLSGVSAFAATPRALEARDHEQLLLALNQAPCEGMLALAMKDADAIAALNVTDVSNTFEGTNLKGQRILVKQFSLRTTRGGWTGGAPSQPVAKLDVNATIRQATFAAPRYEVTCKVTR